MEGEAMLMEVGTNPFMKARYHPSFDIRRQAGRENLENRQLFRRRLLQWAQIRNLIGRRERAKNRGGESMLKEFRDFAMRGNVIDLAIGIIIGAAFTTVVNSLVKDIIMPPIGYLMNGIDFSNFFITLTGSGEYPSLKAAQDAGAVSINYGVFINAIINFLIVAFAVFILVKQVNRFRKEAPAEPPAPTASEKLLMEIRDALQKR
jgi:large conductance mechanosensitive channel